MTTEQLFQGRPISEVFARHSGYGFAGDGVHTAVGNFTRTGVDLPMSDGLLAWVRTYNSRDDSVGALGRGWVAAHAAYLDVGSVDQVRFHDRDGRVLTFVRDESGVYRRPPDLDADLDRGVDGSYTLRFFCGETWSFDAEGRLLVWSYEGRQVRFQRAEGRLVALAHSAGARLDLEYGAGGFVSRVRADDGSAVSYEYTGSVLTAATKPDGGVVRYEYSDEGQLARIIDADDITVVANGYDDSGRVQHQDLAGAGGVDFRYDDAERRTEVTATPAGARTVFEHDDSARVVGVTDPLGNRTTLAHNEDGRLVEATLPSGTRIDRAYDDDGNLVRSTWGEATATYAYDGAHRLLESTDPAGATTRYGYEGDSNIPTSITDTSGAHTGYTVENGLVVVRRDPDGGTDRYEYDERRNLTAFVDATGQRTENVYDAAGRRISVTSPGLETTRYEYDAAGRVVSVTDAAGGVTGYRYSSSGQLLETTDPAGASNQYTYDAAGRLSERTDRLGATTTYDYDDSGNVSTLRQPNGAEVTLEYDPLDRLSAAHEPDAGTTRYEYDADGNLIVEDRPEGVTRTDWDDRGNPVAITEPDGAVARFAYDAVERITAFTDPTGAVWRIGYDDERRIVRYTDPLDAVTTEQRNPGGQRHSIIDALGRRTKFRYDKAGRIVEVIDPEGGRTRYVYDSDGRRISTTTPAGLVTRYEYENDRLVVVVDPRGWIARFRYDKRGNRTKIIKPSGATVTYAYDDDNRLIRQVDPRGGVTRYAYDAMGNLTSITDPKGAVTRYRHDRAGRRTSATDPLVRTTRREYDDAGNLTAIIEPSGKTIRMEYDAARRLTRRVGDDGTEVRYAYDRAGRRVSMTDAIGRTRYDYDNAGRLVKVTESDGGEVGFEYDRAGQRVELRYPDDSTVRYRYDLNGRLVGLRDSNAGEAVYAVDADGRPITEQLPGSWARRYAYDGGLLARFEEIRSGIPAIRTRLERDPDGRISVQDDGDQEWYFSYDLAGELVSINRRTAGEPDIETHVAYDIAGNRTALVHGEQATRYLYDIADQLIAVETTGRTVTFDYDDSGRLIEENDGDIRHRIDYDGLGLPSEITRTRAWARERLCPTFNGDGLLTELVAQTGDHEAPETKVRYRWSVGDNIPEILTQRVRTDVPQANHTAPIGRDLASARFTYGYGRTFATTKLGSVNFAHDVHGSAIRTEQTKPWVQASAYDPFGLADSVPPNRAPLLFPETPRFGYRGELAYGSMVNLRARSYDAALGRFTTRDPVSVLGESSLANHPYAYAGNDPLNKADPLGDWALAASALTTLAELIPPVGAPCTTCPDPGNSIESHLKCFQDLACLATRGFLSQDALDANPETLKSMWYSRRGEAACHALAIHELNRRRRGFWDKFFGRNPVKFNVDWEVGTRGPVSGGFRIDIVTDERNIFEVKEWRGPATWRDVDAQLRTYRALVVLRYYINFDLGTELQDWADSFDVTKGFWSWTPFNREYVYVWGLGNAPGHIYFAKKDKVDDKVRSKADSKREEREFAEQNPFAVPIPIFPRVPVPVP